MRKLFILPLLVVIFNSAFSQSGKVSGKVINAASGQPLAGATIALVEKSRLVISDQNGNFSFSKMETGTYSIKCSFIGYSEKTIEEIIITAQENPTLTISLDEQKNLQEEVVVKSHVRASKESVASLLISQKNSASVSDGISSESIRKTPDKTTSDVLKRVSGASIQDDRFAIIRGLNDRYNAAFINGAPLPSTESDRKAFAFDIFPSSILDNLVIYKTATPDKSGEFAGGIIDITTKSTLSKSFLTVTVGGAYNSLLTGKVRYYPASKGDKDYIGVDDGTRAIPAGIPDSKELKNLTFAERADLAKLFGNYNWGIKNGNTSPNFNFQITKGLNFERKRKEFLAAIFSINYNKSFTFTDGDRNSYDFDLTAPESSELRQKGRYKDSIYNTETIIAVLGNISVKLNNYNSLSWKNNFSINTDNKLIKRIGAPDYSTDSTFVVKDIVRWFTSNKIFSSQLSGDHQVGPIKTKINWLTSYSRVEREIPNLSRTSYAGILPDLSGDFSSGTIGQTSGSGTMFFANSDENIKSIKADITQSYKLMKSTQNFVKFGAGYQQREREFTSRLLGFSPYNRGGVAFDYSLLSQSEDSIFLPQHLGKMSNGMGGFLLNDGTLPNSNYSAASDLTHVYLMSDQRFFKSIRLIAGARIETFHQKLNSVKNISDSIAINTKVTDLLPSINLVYSLTQKMNIRLSYSQTVNRPEFRELAPYLFYDNVTQYTYEGFDTLKRAKITNYDFRYEFFPGRAQLFSISAFYKEFTNPIEIVSNPVFDNLAIYSNAKSAKVYGIEAEFRTLVSTIVGIRNEDAFLNRFTLAANAAYTKSSVKLGNFGFYDPALLVTDRALQGQSPYIINFSAGYSDNKAGFSTTVSVNRVGDRIIIAGTIFDADIYEKARTVVDFQLAKLFMKNKLEVRFTAKDLLSQKVNFYFDMDKSKSFTERDRYFSSNTAPKILNLTATYRF